MQPFPAHGTLVIVRSLIVGYPNPAIIILTEIFVQLLAAMQTYEYVEAYNMASQARRINHIIKTRYVQTVRVDVKQKLESVKGIWYLIKIRTGSVSCLTASLSNTSLRRLQHQRTRLVSLPASLSG